MDRTCESGLAMAGAILYIYACHSKYICRKGQQIEDIMKFVKSVLVSLEFCGNRGTTGKPKLTSGYKL